VAVEVQKLESHVPSRQEQKVKISNDFPYGVKNPFLILTSFFEKWKDLSSE